VRNKTGPGFEGVSRQEGNQTLKAERSGQALARDEWTSNSSMCCRELKPMRGLDRCGGRVGVAG